MLKAPNEDICLCPALSFSSHLISNDVLSCKCAKTMKFNCDSWQVQLTSNRPISVHWRYQSFQIVSKPERSWNFGFWWEAVWLFPLLESLFYILIWLMREIKWPKPTFPALLNEKKRCFIYSYPHFRASNTISKNKTSTFSYIQSRILYQPAPGYKGNRLWDYFVLFFCSILDTGNKLWWFILFCFVCVPLEDVLSWKLKCAIIFCLFHWPPHYHDFQRHCAPWECFSLWTEKFAPVELNRSHTD